MQVSPVFAKLLAYGTFLLNVFILHVNARKCALVRASKNLCIPGVSRVYPGRVAWCGGHENPPHNLWITLWKTFLVDLKTCCAPPVRGPKNLSPGDFKAP